MKKKKKKILLSLDREIEEVRNCLLVMTPETSEYTTTVKNLETLYRIRNELLNSKSERTEKIVKIVIEVVTLGGSAAAAWVWLTKAFKYEETGHLSRMTWELLKSSFKSVKFK